ncbi:Prostaglandin-H2 D-isomerase [Channa argus]|uniref:Prostaglandin-H2 D-isomerase n=1 Tax=Channa argus TaxID=215402 RepID=A0A6G1QLP8_CHAAH|nr:Prostaglandin-H2 D-isomerase [Channa argus]
MSITVLKIVGALTFGLAVWAEVTPVKDFNLEKMAGKWFVVGFATNAKWFVDQKADMKVGTAVLVATADGDLDLSYAYLKVANVVYDDYALIVTNKTADAGSYIVHELFSRTQETSVALQQNFTQVSLDNGILPENIAILPKSNGEQRMIANTTSLIVEDRGVDPCFVPLQLTMAGKWYMVGFATNSQWFVNNRAEMKMGTAVLVATAEGNVDLSYARLRDDGTCFRMTYFANKMDTPGHYSFHSHIWNNDNDMTIVDVLYDDYALVHTIETKDGVSGVVNKLFSRTQETNVAVQQKFTRFSLDTGILPKNIVFLPENRECPEA